MKPKKIPYQEFKKIYSKVPRLCVDLIIKNKKGVLLTKRDISPNKGWWHFPGGTVLMHETLKDTVQRVGEEELNTKVKILKSLGILEYTKGSGLGCPISVTFLVKPINKIVGGEQARVVDFFIDPPSKTLPEVKDYIKKGFKTSF